MSLQVNKHKAGLHLIRTLFPRQYFVIAHGQKTSTGELTCQYLKMDCENIDSKIVF